jgi:hypothetical protein
MEKVAEATISAVPLVGGPLAVAFTTVIGWSISERTDEWLEQLAEEVERLGKRLEDLAEEPAFVDAVVTATRAAQATHQEERLAALRNGVLHSVGRDAPEVDEQARFFRLISDFTAGHLHLLAFLDAPRVTFEKLSLEQPTYLSSSRGGLVAQLPTFAGRADWAGLLFSDLSNAHLINAGGLNTTMTGAGVWEPCTTDMGKRFLAFITAPE